MRIYRKKGVYEKYIKRILDIICSLLAIVIFWWLFIIIAILVKVKLGSPVIFKQMRPGMIDPKTGQEEIFEIYKFRTMSDERDEDGNLLPDEIRLGRFGKTLRATSLDEIVEVFNILKGNMSIVGPRPQLVRDMVFMTDEQRLRHTAKPGLSGLAQIKGRNSISWEEKLNWDLQYIENVSLKSDIKIVFLTVKQVFIQTDSMKKMKEIDVTDDYGVALLKEGIISKEEYDARIAYAEQLLESVK